MFLGRRHRRWRWWLMRTELEAVEQHGQWLLLAVLRAAAAGVRARHRQDRQRRAPLAEPRRRQLPGGRGGEAAATSSGWPATSCASPRKSSATAGRRCSSRSASPALLVGLLLLQPDFGSLSLILAITAGMLVLGGVNMPRMFGPVLVGLPVLAIDRDRRALSRAPLHLVHGSVGRSVRQRLPADAMR